MNGRESVFFSGAQRKNSTDSGEQSENTGSNNNSNLIQRCIKKKVAKEVIIRDMSKEEYTSDSESEFTGECCLFCGFYSLSVVMFQFTNKYQNSG